MVRRRLLILVSSVIIAMVVNLASALFFIDNRSKQESMKKTDFELQRLKRISARLGEYEGQEAKIKANISGIEALENTKSKLFVPLQDIASAIPDEILLTELSLEGTHIEIKAQAFADYEQGQSIVAEFIRNLEETKHFSAIVLKPFTLEKITPATIGANGELRLTLPEKREFSLTAEISY